MNVVLIPFFLAAQFPVQESEKWSKGAEITYRVEMAITLSAETNDRATFQMHQDCAMKCRPKDVDTLLCSLRNIKIRAIDEGVSENKEYEFANPFEIKFNERGVEHLVVTYPHNMEYLSMIRKAAAQLHVGCDLKNLVSNSFVAKENFTLGQCDTTFNVTWFNSSSLREGSDAHVKLILLNRGEKGSFGSVAIEKSRDPERCSDSSGYLSLSDHVVTSFSGVTMEDELFEGYSVTIAKVKKGEGEIIRELVKVRLESILQADDPLPTIVNRSIASLAVNEEIEHNFLDPRVT